VQKPYKKNNSFQSDFIVTTIFGQKHPKTAIVQYIENIKKNIVKTKQDKKRCREIEEK